MYTSGEKKKLVINGSVWSDNGQGWPHMHTNSSRYISGLNDFVWKTNDEMHPYRNNVVEFLNKYIKFRKMFQIQ